jgi:sugar lactone lactonase YvrE
VDAELLLDARAELGEGPLWDGETLTWVDLLAGAVHRLGLDGVPGRSLAAGRRVGCAVPRAGGGLLLGTDAGFASERELIVPLAESAADWFLNDGRADAAGRLWAGTVLVADGGGPVPGGGTLYRLDPDLSLTAARRGVTLSNGLDWSPDGRTLYYVDSAAGGIDAHEFDLDAGAIGAPRRVIEIDPAEGFADGMCVDADGAIWTAVWGTGEVRRYTPAGALDRVISLPVSQPTSCAFAGDVLVITSAWHLLDARARAAQPLAGGVFACRPGAHGREEHRFGG